MSINLCNQCINLYKFLVFLNKMNWIRSLFSSSDSGSVPSSLPASDTPVASPPKNLWWILGGVVFTTACGYLAYKLYKRKAGNVRYLVLEFLDKKCLLDLLDEIRTSYTAFYTAELKQHRKIRRRYPKESVEYTKAVADFQLKLRNGIGDAIQEVLKRYKLHEENFNDSLEYYNTDQDIIDAFDRMSEPSYTTRKPSDLTLAKTKRILEAYRNLESSTSAEDIALQQSVIEDTIFERWGYEKEQVEAAYTEYSEELHDIASELTMHTSQVFHEEDS